MASGVHARPLKSGSVASYVLEKGDFPSWMSKEYLSQLWAGPAQASDAAAPAAKDPTIRDGCYLHLAVKNKWITSHISEIREELANGTRFVSRDEARKVANVRFRLVDRSSTVYRRFENAVLGSSGRIRNALDGRFGESPVKKDPADAKPLLSMVQESSVKPLALGVAMAEGLQTVFEDGAPAQRRALRAVCAVVASKVGSSKVAAAVGSKLMPMTMRSRLKNAARHWLKVYSLVCVSHSLQLKSQLVPASRAGRLLLFLRCSGFGHW